MPCLSERVATTFARQGKGASLMRDWIFFTAACAVVCVLMILPPDVARWFAIGLLVLVVLSPAVGRRS